VVHGQRPAGIELDPRVRNEATAPEPGGKEQGQFPDGAVKECPDAEMVGQRGAAAFSRWGFPPGDGAEGFPVHRVIQGTRNLGRVVPPPR